MIQVFIWPLKSTPKPYDVLFTATVAGPQLITSDGYTHTHSPLWVIHYKEAWRCSIGNGLLVTHSVHVRRQTNKFVSRPGLPSEKKSWGTPCGLPPPVWLQFRACSLYLTHIPFVGIRDVCCGHFPITSQIKLQPTDSLTHHSIDAWDRNFSHPTSNCENRADCRFSFRIDRSRDAKEGIIRLGINNEPYLVL